MSKNVVVLLVGCVTVLLLVCCVASVAFIVLGNPAGLVAQFLPSGDFRDVTAPIDAVVTPATQSRTTPPPASAGNSFSDALGRANTAKKFRVEFSWVFGGTENGKYQEMPFIDFKGEVDGQNSHMTSKGGILAMLAKDANSPVEFIEAGGKTYMKGITMFGMTDPKLWYVSDDDSTTSSFAEFAKPDEYKDWVSGAKAGEIKKVRTEQLDGQSCDVYLYDMKLLQNSALTGLLSVAQDKSAFSAVDKGDMNLWLCGDGFVHKFSLDFQAHDSTNPAQKAALKMLWHAWDFDNAAISVTVPKDAKSMPK